MSGLDNFKNQLREVAGITAPLVVMQDNGNVSYIKSCRITLEEYTVTITTEQYNRITIGKELTQRVLPHLTIEQRDFIITGQTPDEMIDIHKDVSEEE